MQNSYTFASYFSNDNFFFFQQTKIRILHYLFQQFNWKSIILFHFQTLLDFCIVARHLEKLTVFSSADIYKNFKL